MLVNASIEVCDIRDANICIGVAANTAGNGLRKISVTRRVYIKHLGACRVRPIRENSLRAQLQSRSSDAVSKYQDQGSVENQVIRVEKRYPPNIET